MKSLLIAASFFLFETAFAGSLQDISKLVTSPEVQQLEQKIKADGGSVLGVLEDSDSLIPGGTSYLLIYKDSSGTTQKISNLYVPSGAVGGVR